MRSKFLLLLAFSLPLAAQTTPAKKANTDQEDLQGWWEITSGGYYGSQQNTSTTQSLVIAGDTLTFEENGRVLSRGTFKLQPCQTPKAIDIEIVEGQPGSKGTKSLGIYKLNGDTLAWCRAELGSTDRPKDFIADAKHPQHNPLTFKRKQP